MKTFTALDLKLADMLIDSLRRVDSVYCSIKERKLCDYLQQYGWVKIKTIFPGDDKHEGRIFMEKGPNYIAFMDKTFSHWYKDLNRNSDD